MKRIFTILMACAMSVVLFGQAPQKMSYQAVVRNLSNDLVKNQAVGMRISILQGSVSGTVVYSETQVPTTNVNGLVTIQIGGGSGFDTISWANGPYFIKTETDPTGGSSYTITGTSQLLSVPYALYAGKVSTFSYNNLTNKPTLTNGTVTSVDVSGGTTGLTTNGGPVTGNGIITLGGTLGVANGGTGTTDGSITGLGTLNFAAGGSNNNITLTPSGSGNVNVTGKLKVVDGTQGANKVLTSDASGLASWSNNNTSIVFGSLSLTGNNVTSTTGFYTGASITLPPGKWAVQIRMVGGSTACSAWIRSGLSSSSTTNTTPSDVIGSNSACGYKAANAFASVTGIIIVNNTSAGSKTYYYWTGTIDVYTGSLSLVNFGTTGWGEDQMIAFPVY